MHWVQSLDIDLFRFANDSLRNPILDVLMPFVSGNAFFHPALALLAILLVWKGRARGVVCVLMLALVLAVGDGFICNTLKHAIGRPRPFLALEDVHLLVGRSGSGSMPSSHAANWFAAAMVAFVYYRRSLWFTLPIAVLVSFSRLYVGVHYPSDVLAGAVVGAGSAAAILWSLDALWSWVGRRWFPLWWPRFPSLLVLPAKTSTANEESSEDEAGPALDLPKTRGMAPAGFRPPHASLDDHWLRLGYLFIVAVLIARWAYLASGAIQLAEDEAYQWLWSKHLALSYFSKPPLIAYTQFLGTSLWGDVAFGVRFFSPVIAAVLGWIVLRFFAREVNARAGFFLILIVSTAPLLSVGSVLMTVDPLSVLFWTTAMLAGWKAVRDDATTIDWLWVGLWMGLGFLSKYTALFQWLCWAVFFALWPPARKQLRRPGPYLALLVNVACALPVLIWNAQHHWVTVDHVADNAGAGKAWHPTLRFLFDFIGAEAGLLNPVFFVAPVWAAFAFWTRARRNPKLIYFFSMGAPVFLAYVLQSFRTRILPNWIAPSVLPLFILMVIYWDLRWRLGDNRALKRWLVTGLVLGTFLVLVFHNTNVIGKVSGHYLPVQLDPLHRVREWDTTAYAVETARQRLQEEGRPTFIITDHYGMAGQISFYLPEAKAKVKGQPLVYCRSSEIPENQFFFWPGYGARKGENAIYVRELNRKDPTPLPPPPRLLGEFESVTDLGVTNVLYHGRDLLRPLQLFACRGVR
jgi:4-amino-4-deoxy-L-arabinose transferase-like glycosyltransferase/membrane-associated phospholipid phosphatase